MTEPMIASKRHLWPAMLFAMSGVALAGGPTQREYDNHHIRLEIAWRSTALQLQTTEDGVNYSVDVGVGDGRVIVGNQ